MMMKMMPSPRKITKQHHQTCFHNVNLTSTMALPSLAIPGQLLGPISKHTPGPGSHTYNSQLYASIAGPITSTPSPTSISKPTTKSSPPTFSISRPHSSTTNVLPTVDAIVLCRVTRIQARQATVAILVVGETVCADEFQGVIRKEDVRATEKDKVILGASFLPGDIVRACVVRPSSPSLFRLGFWERAAGKRVSG